MTTERLIGAVLMLVFWGFGYLFGYVEGVWEGERSKKIRNNNLKKICQKKKDSSNG
jgi:hypothetical protein